MSETHDHSKIKWIKGELDEVVLKARNALEQYMDGAGDTELMVSCGKHLHQVHGTLRILELYGATMLAEEMEAVANSIANGEIESEYMQHAADALMQSLVSLPDYMEKLQEGALDHPTLVLPLINDLRIVRGVDIFTEAELAAPELEQRLARLEKKVEGGSRKLPKLAKKIRYRYHLCLLKWFHNTDPVIGIEGLKVILEKLQEVSDTGQVRWLFQVARAALAAPLENLESPNTSIKLLFGKVDRELKRIIKEGEHNVAEAPTVSTLRDLLYHVASVRDEDELVKAIKQEFDLDSIGLSKRQIELGRESLALPNSELLESLRQAISAELAEIKDVLDLFIRTKNRDPGQLQALEIPMRKVADTLGMIGHKDLRQRMQRQADKIKEIATAGGVTKESELLGIAEDIIFVEASLDNLTCFVKTQIISKTGAAGHEQRSERDLPEGEFERLTDSVVREASVDMAKIKDAILAYIKDPKKAQILEKVPQHFHAIAGAFEMLKMFDVSGLLRATAGYVSNELIANNTIPDMQRLNAFADAITSIEYFMETIADGRGVQNEILDVAREALVRLGTEDDAMDEEYFASAIGEESIPGVIHEDDMEPSSEQKESSGSSDDVVRFREERNVEILREHVPSAEKPSLQEIDPEILEIFIEEAQEELEVIREYMGKWLDNVEDTDALITFRRSFHTLKGSGRLVGAKVIGEFAWSIENLLNRVIDKTLDVTTDVTDLLREVMDVLPVLIDYQSRGVEPEIDVEPIAEMAHKLATPDYSSSPTSATVVDLEIVESESIPDEEVEEEPDDAAVDADLSGIDDIQMNEDSPIILDPVLLDIFTSESRTHIDTINSFLNACKEMGGVCNLDNNVSRAFHTLHGSAHMAGVDPIAEVSAALEAYVNELLEQNRVADAALLGLIERADEQFEAILQAINVPDADIPDWRSLLQDIEAAHELIQPEDEDDGLEDSGIILGFEQDEDSIEITGLLEEPEGEGLELEEQLENIEIMPHELELQAEFEETEVEETEEEQQQPESVIEPDLGAEPEIKQEQPEPVVPLAKVEQKTAETESDSLMMDDDLISIFLEESVELMDDVDHALNAWNAEPANLQTVHELQRTLHTLKGGARLAGIQEIGDLSHVFESFIAGIESGTVTNNSKMRSLAQRVADNLVTQIEDVSTKGQTNAADETIAEIKAILSGEADSAKSLDEDATEQDEQLRLQKKKEEQEKVEKTKQEKEEKIDLDEQEESVIEEEAEIVEEINLVAGPELEEELKFDEEPVLEEVIELIEEKSGPDEELNPEEEINLEEDTEPEPELDPELELKPEEQPEVLAQDEDAQVLPFPEQRKEAEQDDEDDTQVGEQAQAEESGMSRPVRRFGREFLRVNPDVMDKLVNHAGEVSIFRSRLEQQSGSMGYSIEEMKNTVDRLRDQLRKLDMETEAQILFRYERDREEGKLGDAEDFDPLELDRFSTMQQLSRGLMETVGDLGNINKILESEQKETETLLLQQSRITTDLQDGLMRTRMVSFNQLVPRLQRIVRQTCQPLEKQAELVIKGADMELDRSILDRITAPLEHLLRNAISHGIEEPKKRKKLNKPEVGRITIDLARDGNDVVLTVSDDGRGLDFSAIRERAEKAGLLASGAEASEGDLTQFILEHGFSTADSVSQISGRGVGLDVVVSEVKQLGGTMDINSTAGDGTEFIVYLPLTLAITDALLLKVYGEIYAVPYTNIESVVRINRDDLISLYEGDQTYPYGGQEYALKYLGVLLGKGKPNLAEQKKRIPILLVRAGKHRVAMHIDDVVGNRQIVVKSVGPQLSTIRWITGGTILGDGRVALILDVNALVRKGASHATEVEEAPVQVAPEKGEDKIKIMVVDDSITVRKVTGRLLERHGMDVETAKDGVEALAMLQDIHPDVMLLDIEMPRMDGFEVARNMRNSDKMNDIPIIIITSRTGEKHRKLAMDLGVKRYLGKPYQETDLIETIQEVLEESKQ